MACRQLRATQSMKVSFVLIKLYTVTRELVLGANANRWDWIGSMGNVSLGGGVILDFPTLASSAIS